MKKRIWNEMKRKNMLIDEWIHTVTNNNTLYTCLDDIVRLQDAADDVR